MAILLKLNFRQMETFKIPTVKDIHGKEYQIFDENVISSCFSLNCNYGAAFDNANEHIEDTYFYLNEEDILKLLSVCNQLFPECKDFGKLIDLHISRKS